MSEELKGCPLCGEKANKPRASALLQGVDNTFCTNRMCPMSSINITLDEWQTRPIEDGLRAEIEQLDGKYLHLQEIVETEREETLSVMIALCDVNAALKAALWKAKSEIDSMLVADYDGDIYQHLQDIRMITVVLLGEEE